MDLKFTNEFDADTLGGDKPTNAVSSYLDYDTLLKEMETSRQPDVLCEGFGHSDGEFDQLQYDNGVMDLNVDHYTTSTLMELLELDETANSFDDILNRISIIKSQFKESNMPELVSFFCNVQQRLMSEVNLMDTENKQVQVESPLETPSRVLDDIGDVADTSKDTVLIPFNTQNNDGVNPLLRENTTRLISIDSFYRHNSLPSLNNIAYSSIKDDYLSTYSTTNFVTTLSEPVTFVSELTLESVRIPNTFYNIDSAYGNNTFIFRFTDDPNNTFNLIELTPGNYTIDVLSREIRDELIKLYPTLEFRIDLDDDTTINDVFFNPKTGKLCFHLERPFEILFYSTDYNKYYHDKPVPKVLPRLNFNLGWLLGFRDPFYLPESIELDDDTYKLVGEAVVDLCGPRHFVIVLDDFNCNHLNKAIVSSENTRETPSLPTYVNDNLNITMLDGTETYQQVTNGTGNIDDYPIIGDYPFYTQDMKKTLTQAQLFSLNEIVKERNKTTNQLIQTPTENNVFALVPNIRQNDTNFEHPIILTSNMLRENVRHYFGKVDIERMAIRLYDDRGNLMNLNGSNWSFTVKALCSYNTNKPQDYVNYSHNIHY